MDGSNCTQPQSFCRPDCVRARDQRIAAGGIPGDKVTVEGEAVLKMRAQDRRSR